MYSQIFPLGQARVAAHTKIATRAQAAVALASGVDWLAHQLRIDNRLSVHGAALPSYLRARVRACVHTGVYACVHRYTIIIHLSLAPASARYDYYYSSSFSGYYSLLAFLALSHSGTYYAQTCSRPGFNSLE